MGVRQNTLSIKNVIKNWVGIPGKILAMSHRSLRIKTSIAYFHRSIKVELYNILLIQVNKANLREGDLPFDVEVKIRKRYEFKRVSSMSNNKPNQRGGKHWKL